MFISRLIAALVCSLVFFAGPVSAQKSLSWMQVPGGANDISVGADGTVWVVGNNKAPGGYDIWRYKGNRAWQRIPGGAMRIAVDPKGNAWVVNNTNAIFRYDGKGWRKMPGKATDIGIGANGAIWIAGTNTAPYRWNGKNWTRVGGGDIVRVAVDPNGNAWVINKSDVIFRYTSSGFKQLPGRARDVGIGANGAVWIVGTDKAPYRWTGRTWQKHAGAFAGITVDPKGFPWAVNAGKQIFADRRSSGVTSTPARPVARPKPQRVTALPWQIMPGLAVDVSVAANGAPWLAGTDGAAYVWNGRAWIKAGGREISRVAADPKDGIWVTTKKNQVWRYRAGTWKKLVGVALDIGVGANGMAWVVGNDGAGWRWTGKTWKRAGGRNFVRIAVDPKGNAWALDKSNGIFRYANKRFRQMPGGARDIGIGANGAVWVAGTDGAPWRWDGKTWRKHAGGVSGIAVDPKGFPWAVNANRQIFADKRSRSLKSPPKPPASVSAAGGGGLSAASASRTLNRYPKFKNVKVSWKRNGKTLTANARIGNANAQAIAFTPTRNRPAITALIVPNMTIANLLPIRGPNPLGSYNVRNVVVFTVPAARKDTRHRVADLPAAIATALRKNDAAFAEADATIDLAPGMTYFAVLDKPRGLVKTAFDRMKLRNIGVAGSIAFTEYSKPVNTVTLTARLKKDPLTDVLGPVRVIAVDKSAEPTLFVTATGATDFEVGYSSTFRIFKQVIDGTLAFSKSGVGAAAETAVTVELSKAGSWRDPHLSGRAKLRNVTLNDAVITLSRTLGGAASGTSLSVVTQSTKIHRTTYAPAAFTFTLEGASALPKAAFVDLATKQVSLRQMAELMEVTLQLTPQGQLAQRSPLPPGQVFSTLGLDKLPSNLIAFRNPKIYLATPGAVEPDPPPAPPLPAIAGAGVHVRGNLVAFGKQLARTATRIDFDGLHIDTRFRTLPLGGFTLQNPRFKLDAVPNKRPVASFSGRTKIGPVPVASARIDIGQKNFGYNVKTACIALARVEASGRTSGFKLSVPKPTVQTCIDTGIAGPIIAGAEATARVAVSAGNAVVHSANDIANKSTGYVGGAAAVAAYNAAMRGYNAAKDAWDRLSSFWKSKKSKPRRPSRPVPLRCKAAADILWDGRCLTNYAARFSAGAGASQSSDYQSQYNAGLLVDGNIKAPTASTKFEPNPWANFSVGRKRVWVDKIVIVNRADKYASQLDGAIVAVSAKYSGRDLMTKQDSEIYRIRLKNPGRAVTVRPGKWGEGKWAKNVMVYHLPTAKKPKSVIALQEVMLFSNDCKCPNYWRRVPYAAVDIAAGPRKIWHINITGHLYSSAVPLKDMPTAKNPWKKVTPNPDPNGVMHRVTVDPWGNPWVVLTGGQIYRYNSGRWIRVPGDARDIAAAKTEMLMASGFNGMEIYAKPYGAPDAIKSWKFTGGHAIQIAAWNDSPSWQVKKSGDIWQKPQGRNGRKMTGSATDIGTNGKNTFHIGTGGVPYKFVPGNNSWVRMHGSKNKRIAVDATGRPWMVAGNGHIWTWHDYKK